jgi:hypothetical protein
MFGLTMLGVKKPKLVALSCVISCVIEGDIKEYLSMVVLVVLGDVKSLFHSLYNIIAP